MLKEALLHAMEKKKQLPLNKPWLKNGEISEEDNE